MISFLTDLYFTLLLAHPLIGSRRILLRPHGVGSGDVKRNGGECAGSSAASPKTSNWNGSEDERVTERV